PQGTHFLVKSLNNEQPELSDKVDKVWRARGSSVHEGAINQPDHLKLFVTKIMQESESDMVFPEVDLGRYKHIPEYTDVLPEVQEEKCIKCINLKSRRRLMEDCCLTSSCSVFLLTSQFDKALGLLSAADLRSNYFFRER
ncbi:Dihydrofolate reductase, partial [Lemmus lemmus]